MATKRKPAPRRLTRLELTGELEGFSVTMAGMTGSDLLRIRGGQMDETDSINLFAEHVVEHNFDVPDPRDLEFWVIVEILRAWTEGMNAAAVPEANGDS